MRCADWFGRGIQQTVEQTTQQTTEQSIEQKPEQTVEQTVEPTTQQTIEQKPEQSGLARTTASNDKYELAFLYINIDILECLIAPRICHTHVL